MRPEFDLSVYLVTDRKLSGHRTLSEVVKLAVEGGATIIQLREKNLETRAFLEQARALKALLQPLNIPLIINDRMDIALAVGADGIHVGQSDMAVEEVRNQMGPDVLIGLSVESVEDAKEANDLDIDYIGISPVYTTPTKKELKTGLGLEGVSEITRISKFPSVAIGGIDSSNTEAIIKAGADGVAVVSAICASDDPRKATNDLAEAVSQAKLIGF